MASVRALYGVAPAMIVLELIDGRRLPIPWRTHSPDYRSVWWDGVRYSFTEPMANVVRVLWEHQERGTPEIGWNTLKVLSGSVGARLIDVFMTGKTRKEGKTIEKHVHAAWGVLIVPGNSKGSHRLAD